MRTTLVAAIAAALLGLAGSACAQEWNYQTYSQLTNRATTPGVFKLTKVGDGKYKARLFLEGSDSCFRRELDASVVLEADQQIVTAAPLMIGCPEIRLVLKNDGSGGQRQLKDPDGTWKWDGTERGLTRKQ